MAPYNWESKDSPWSKETLPKLGVEAYETTDPLLRFLEYTFYLALDLTVSEDKVSINH